MRGIWQVAFPVLALIALGPGCSHPQKSQAQTGYTAATEQGQQGYQQYQQHQGGVTGAQAQNCPMHVQGTNVTTEDVDNGIALNFTTDSGDVNDLRQRVQRMAEQHNQHFAGATSGQEQPSGEMGTEGTPQGGTEGMTGEGGMHGRMQSMSILGVIVPSAASVQYIDNGARLILTLLHELGRRQQTLGLATLCVGGGQGGAVIVERLAA